MSPLEDRTQTGTPESGLEPSGEGGGLERPSGGCWDGTKGKTEAAGPSRDEHLPALLSCGPRRPWFPGTLLASVGVH